MTSTAPTRSATFPEPWDAPVAGNGTFGYDPMHFPYPLSPLTLSSAIRAFGDGFTLAARELSTPIKHVHVMSRNWYRFEWYEMFQPASEEEARQLGETAEATLKPELGRLLERWNGEHLPAIQKNIERLRALDVESVPAARVVEAIDEIEAIHLDLWTIHFRIAIPMLLGLQIFDEFYADVFGDGAGVGDGHALLVGGNTESIKAGIGLYDLALRATELGLAPVLADAPQDGLRHALEQTETGRTFLAELDSYLESYGYRQDLFEFMTPTWREDPTIALSLVSRYLQTGQDERAAFATRRAAAEHALTAAREQLAAYPEAVRGQFEGLLQIGRASAFLQEEHNFYIDQQGLAHVRLAYLRIGRRLVADGVLASAEDVFMLQVDELRDLFAKSDLAGRAADVHALVATRRAELEQAGGMTPPPFLGTPPAGLPPTGNPMERAMGRFFGGPPQQSENPNELKGNAGSRGIASGPAFIARTLEEANGLQPGDILVAVTTMPAWTPLFGVAAAVVTETGGPLSHCAIVAREYGIPAVVGAHGATHAIQPGRRITVDGGRGIVTIDA